jgi:PhzF family phenazine biosynthesis protein
VTQLRFSQVDVFAASPYRGNPLAVVHDATGLSTEEMQQFARWTNLSETTFLLPPSRPGADYQVRIFTGTEELPFAGHPTLGSCHAWLAAHPGHDGGEVVQECGVGLVTVRRGPDGLAFAAPPLLRDAGLTGAELEDLAAELGLPTDRIRAARLIDNGPGWTGVLLEDADAVLAVDGHGLRRPVGLVGPRPAGDPYAIEVRAFFPSGGISFEDPVTGSLNAALGQWLLGAGILQAPYRAHQGTRVGADGAVLVDQDGDGTVWVSGATATMITGSVTL